jgi:hypothetical protein
MSLKIKMRPLNEKNPPFVNVGDNIEVTHIDSGIDITSSVFSIDIRVRRDDWVTATLECYVGELDLLGVDIDKIIPHEIAQKLRG